MKSNSDSGSTIKKPTILVSKIISFLGFKNPEDLIYVLAQDYFQYMNYGMFPERNSPNYNGYSEEAINYLELFDLSYPIQTKKLDILEIGCGLGHGAQLIYDQFKPNFLLSIDKSQNAILYANNKFRNSNIIFKNVDFFDINEPEKRFDVIYTVESGGSFPKQEHFELAYRLLKKKGVFLVANINPLYEIAKKREFAIKAGFNIYREKDVTQHVRSYLNSDKKAHKLYSAINTMPFHKSILCKLFMKNLREFARLPGSKAYDLIGNKEFYYHFCFKKP